MLKVWKKKWKASHTSEDHDRRASIGGADLTASGLESNEAALPSGDSSLDGEVWSTHGPSKRRREDSPSASHKRKKTSSEAASFVESVKGREVLGLALKENLIFAAPDADAAVAFLAEYIVKGWEDWESNDEIKYPVVIVDALSITKSSLQVVIPHIDVVTYGAVDLNIRKSKRQVLLIDSPSLLDDLTRDLIELRRVGSLVFGNIPSCEDGSSLAHPILRIMKNFYMVLEPSSRPHILAGLFAPTSFCSNVTFNSLVLEATLGCKIYGLTAESRTKCLVEPFPVRESVVIYDTPQLLPTTPLVRQLRSLSPNDPSVRRLLKNYQHTLSQLGPFAADLVWRRETEQIDCLSPEIWQLLKDMELTSPNIDISSPNFNVTPKVLKLVQILKCCQGFGDGFRGVIFVHRRIVAHILMQLLSSLGSELGFLRVRVLVGARNLDTSPQDNIIRLLENGSCNLLIATKSVEDLDLPKVSVLIKFDLFDSQLSHARVLSHSLGAEGHIISMVERANSTHSTIVSHLSNLSPRLRAWMNTHCWTPQSSIACETLYTDRDPYFSDSDQESEPASFIRDPTTGSRLYPQDAVNAMYFLPSDEHNPTGEESLYNPLFEFDVQDDGRFICRIKQPFQSVPMPWSDPSLTKAGARRLAAYDVCVRLQEQGLLGSGVFPTTWAIPSDNNALPAIDPVIWGTRVYGKRLPAFWSNSALVSLDPLTRLYPMIISIEYKTNSIPPHAPLLLLTRQPLPDIPAFNVFFGGLPTRVNLTRAEPFSVDEHQFQDIHSYNDQLWRGVLNKPYSSTLHETLALYAPLESDWSCKTAQSSGLLSVFSHISWSSISATLENWIVPLKCDNAEVLQKDTEDALIQDRWTLYTRRYDAAVVRSDLTPLSKPLDPELQGYENLVEFCKARRKGFEGLKDYKQPLLEVSRLPSFIDRLEPVAGPFTPSTTKHRYFIPELCAKVTVPASTFRTALLLPCIMRRVDDFLLVKELNAGLLSDCVSEKLLHAAISAPSAGIEYDYERLELLGDAFLKLLSSIYIFVIYPKADEASMHNYRQAIISNKSLWKNAIAVGLPAFVQSRPFSLKGWFPPRLSTSDAREARESSTSFKTNTVSDDEKNAGETKSQKDLSGSRLQNNKGKQPVQHLGDKALADVVEAIMGAALLSGGIDVALKAAKALNIPLPNIEQWTDFGKRVQESSKPVSVQISSSKIEAIEAIVGCQFKRPQFLVQALTHISKTGVQSTTYERLEFIGDAILDFMVIRHVFHRYQQMGPGALSLLKGVMVSNTTLAAVCVSSGLHHHLLFESDKLAHDIREYEYLLNRARTEEYTLAEKGHPIGQFWHNIESPKVLSDLLESILGALYVSDQYTPVGAEAFFDKVFKPFYDRHITLQTLSHHPKKILFELIQSKGCENYSLDKESNEYLVLVHDVVLASTQDETGISGAKVASCIGLYALEGDPGFLTRTCDCWKKAK
ncbi:hypothetical protein DFJ43DRAFT_1052289 [Lentinula guzmanii]|uniref:RNase III domain-containing protein n=1 Tax=Lentinula guzmanii TaxID=2804957 RepID=A0AA38N3W6_9AGAR|nr:hypothetical protein DFJ43DRAFT_1052289 [Lentinula guzmanii]